MVIGKEVLASFISLLGVKIVEGVGLAIGFYIVIKTINELGWGLLG